VGLLHDYFTAGSDEQAAAAIDLAGGPGGALPPSPELQAAFRAGDRAAVRRLTQPRVRVSEHGLTVLSVKGIDPVEHLAALEQILTGDGPEVVSARPRRGRAVAVRDGGERLILTLTDELHQALTRRAPQRVAAAAAEWAGTDAFAGHGDTEALTHVLHELSRLAHHASDRNHRLYCWLCV
jgi:hypothetical protein